jgi:acid stress-induced BolA-like protein IbaG/YrbA
LDLLSDDDSRPNVATAINEFKGFKTFQTAGDGNCLFASLSHQLASFNVIRSHQQIRQELVDYIQNNTTKVI